ncbi:hypothetical protein [Sphingomicrobium arenosum]|uniref:hypothetical protein n=1 Tax=Sphingomicrobium arenosum TaxID=2233861 RepID=UPI00223E98D9|nr:hypothetical protein [Sphingomicrobium arenosum]
MKKIAFALVGATALTLAACAGEAEEEMVDDTTLTDESYDENAASLEDVIEEPVVEEPAAVEPAAPPVDQIDESDVAGTTAETEDVVGL